MCTWVLLTYFVTHRKCRIRAVRANNKAHSIALYDRC